MTKLAPVPDASSNAKNALDRVLADPSSAIGSAKSALESVLNTIAPESTAQSNPSLPQLVQSLPASAPTRWPLR